MNTVNLATDEIMCDNCLSGCETCAFTRKLKKRLYAVAYEIRKANGGIIPGFIYVKATDAQNAKAEFAHTVRGKKARSVHIVGAAPVVGYFAEEKRDREADQTKLIIST